MQVSRQGSLHLDHHVAILQHTLDGDGLAVLLDVGGIGDLGQAQLLADLRTDLGGITIDCLTAAEHNVLGADTDLVDGSSQDLAGCKGIGTAELTAGDQNSLICTARQQLTQHAFRRRRAHGYNNDLAAGCVLEPSEQPPERSGHQGW